MENKTRTYFSIFHFIVLQIVNPHVTGLKASYVESQYKTLHREILPFNWIDIIENMSLLSVEKLVGGLFVYPASDEVSY